MSTKLVTCRECDSPLIEKSSDLCIYVKSPTEIHLAIKPERRIAVLATKIKQPTPPDSSTTTSTSSSKRKKASPIECRFCENKIGSEIPWGPHGTPFIAFSLARTIITGIKHHPKIKVRDVVTKQPFSSIEQRNDETFLPATSSSALPSSQRQLIRPHLPSTPLHLPSRHDFNPSDSSWVNLTTTPPRDYQIQSYLTALHQNCIVTIPTGCGKTLISAMVISRLKRLNRSHMALFLVDRVPLVFQQSHVLARESLAGGGENGGFLRVCPLCGETKTLRKVRELNDGRYDVLVITAGCFLELAKKKELHPDQFCVVVFDECHHAKREHVYVKILDWLKQTTGSGGGRARILGLTASPVSGKSHPQMVKRLGEMSRLFHDAVIFSPEMKQNGTNVRWVKLTRDGDQDRFCRFLLDRLHVLSAKASLYLPGGLNLFRPGLMVSLDEILQPSSLGRLRGLCNRFSDDHYDDPDHPLHTHLNEMTKILLSMEISDVMGIMHALPLIESFFPQHLGVSFNHSSPRLKHLISILLANKDKRILVIVHTRAVARDLTSLLQRHPRISIIFNPIKIVGHGGFDGMDWTNEQSLALDRFRQGESTLVVSTSVLEEGLDVPECDLVIRMQGVTSLIGFVQSRGRARREESEMVVMVNDWETRRAEAMREQEALVKLAIRTVRIENGVVTPSMAQIERGREEQQGVMLSSKTKLVRHEGLEPIITLRLWIPNVDIEHLKRYANLPFEDDLNELELVEQCITRSFEHAGVGSAIRPFRIDKLRRDVGIDAVFDNALGYLVGIADVTCLLEGGDVSTKDAIRRAVTSCWRFMRLEWDYRLAGEIVWVTSATLNGKQGGEEEDDEDGVDNNRVFENCDCFLGIWDDRSTFINHYQVNGVNMIKFTKQGDIDIYYNIIIEKPERIHISRVIIQDFILVDWNGHGANTVNMFVPLQSAPTCYYENLLSSNPGEFRNCNADNPVLRQLGVNNVLCIKFPANDANSISRLCQNHLSTAVYDTRVTIFDGRHHHRSNEFATTTNDYGDNDVMMEIASLSSSTFLTNDDNIENQNYHENELPTLTTSQGETRDIHWLLLVLFSLRKGCFTPRARRVITSFIIEQINTMPLGELSSSIGIHYPEQPFHAIIHALTSCQTVRYWTNIVPFFKQSYRRFLKTTMKSSSSGMNTYLLASQRPLKTKTVTRREYKMYSVVLTPTRTVYLPLQYVSDGSRLFHNYGSESFVTVSFRDEQNVVLRGEELLEYIRKYISNGVVLAGRKFVFLSASSNQLRTQKATFVDVGFITSLTSTSTGRVKDLTPEKGVNEAVQCFREQIVECQKEVTMAKYLSRLALFCTTCRRTVVLQDSDVILQPDVKTIPLSSSKSPTPLTDGAGKISRSLATLVTSQLSEVTILPAAFQIRWRGVKGVVVVVDDDEKELKGKQMLIRPSMIKFRMGSVNDGTLGVVSYSRWLEPHLNREIITLLTSVGEDKTYIPEGHIYRLQEEELRRCYQLFTNYNDNDNNDGTETSSLAWQVLLSELNPFTHDSLIHMHRMGVSLSEHPFVIALLRTHYRHRIRSIVDKTRIPFREGALLMGIPDPIGVLNEGEVYVNIDPDENAALGEFRTIDRHRGSTIKRKAGVLDQKEVAIWRNPCLNPGDVRTVKAVPRPELSHWKNVVIFPSRPGLCRNLSLECSGGDLDGDLFYVLWDQSLVPPLRTNVEPLEYETFGTTDAEQQKLEKQRQFDNHNLATFVHDVYSNDTLGQIATMHLALCDIKPDGARDELAMALSEAQSYAVDFPKTGIPPVVPTDVKEILKQEGYPDFMQRWNTKSYTSNKPLGQYYRRAASFDVNYTSNDRDNGGNDDSAYQEHRRRRRPITLSHMERCFQVPGSDAYASDAKAACKAYTIALDKIKNEYGLRSETELFLARGQHWHPYISDRGGASRAIRDKLESLQMDFRNEFQRLYYGADGDEDDSVRKKTIRAERAASAWFHEARRCQCLSLELIVAHELYAIIYPKIRPSLLSDFYGLGRLSNAIWHYFKMTQLRDYVLGLAEPKLVAIEMLQKLIPCDYVLQPFGSLSMGFLDHDSDLDIVMFVNPAVMKEHCHDKYDSNNQWQMTKTQQNYFLDKISTFINDEVDDKTVILGARVPLIRCTIASPFESTAEHVTNVDIVCDASGYLKATWLHRLFMARKDVYVAFQILTRWARAAGFVKKEQLMTDDSGEEENDMNDVRAKRPRRAVDFRLLTMGEFHVVILEILRQEWKDSIENPMHANNLVSHLFCIKELQQQGRNSFKTLLDIIKVRDYGILNSASHLLVTFFERIGNMCQGETVHPITFVWEHHIKSPTIAIPSESISPERIRQIELHASPSLHCLLAHADISFLFEVAAGDNHVITLTRKLPLNLSHRIAGAVAFHERRLSILSGADVTIQELDRTACMLLTAKGYPRHVQKLKAELLKCTNMSRWGCRSWVQSSRYFMEDSSFLFVNGVDDVSTQVRFDPDVMLQQLRKIGSHNEVSVVNLHNHESLGETDYSRISDISCLLPVRTLAEKMRRQVTKMPSNSTRFAYISFTVSFGSFAALNMSESLPETSITLSIDELLQGMNKTGRKRKNWERRELDVARQRMQRDNSKTIPKEALEKLKPSVPSSTTPEVKKKRKRRTGIRTTFYPSFAHVNNKHELKHYYHRALIRSGFSHQSETAENQTQISVALTRGFEVQLVFAYEQSSSSSPGRFRLQNASERPLNWIHGTILGSSVVPDARIRLQTSTNISRAMLSLALPEKGGDREGDEYEIPLRPPRSEDGYVLYDDRCLSDKDRNKIVYVRQMLTTVSYAKRERFASLSGNRHIDINARVGLAREYVRLEDGTMAGPSDQCELRLDFDHKLLFEADVNYDDLSRIILATTNDVAHSLKIEGVIH